MNKNPKEYWNILKSFKGPADFLFFKSNIAFLISLYIIVESDSALYIMSSSIVFKNPKEYRNILKSFKKKSTEQENIPEILKDESVIIEHFQKQGNHSHLIHYC
jgi:hypothetical protein